MDDIKKMLIHINHPYDDDLQSDDNDRFSDFQVATSTLTPSIVNYAVNLLDNFNLDDADGNSNTNKGGNVNTNIDGHRDVSKFPKKIIGLGGEILGLSLNIPESDRNPDVDSTQTETSEVNNIPPDKNPKSPDEITEGNYPNFQISDPKKLHPYLQILVPKIFDELRGLGYNPKILESYRTPALQTFYLNRGTSWVGFSYHNIVDSNGNPASQAVDIVDDDMEFDKTERNARFFDRLQALYKKYGFGVIKNDLPHGQIREYNDELLTDDQKKEKENWPPLYSSRREAKRAMNNIGFTTVLDFSGKNTLTSRMFVTWGFIEDYLLQFADNPINSLSFDYPQTSGIPKSVEILNFPELRSCDLDVCMLPGQENISIDTKLIDSPIIRNSSKNYVKDTLNLYFNDSTERFENFAVPNRPSRGYLRNIAVNTSFIERVYNRYLTMDEVSLNSFIFDLLDGINAACGNLWDFTFIGRPYSSSILSVIDKRSINSKILDLIKAKDAKLDFEFSNSFIKSFSLSSALNNKLASQAYIVSLGNQAGFETRNAYLYNSYGNNNKQIIKDRFAKESTGVETSLNGINDDTIDDVTVNPIIHYLNMAYIYLNTGKKKTEALQSITRVVTDVLNFGKDSEVKALMPLDVSVSLPGISGLYFGNTFTLQDITNGGWLPDRYKDYHLFRITRISHTVNSEIWQTDVNTIIHRRGDSSIKYSDIDLEDYVNDAELQNAKDPQPFTKIVKVKDVDKKKVTFRRGLFGVINTSTPAGPVVAYGLQYLKRLVRGNDKKSEQLGS